jgi:membrane protein
MNGRVKPRHRSEPSERLRNLKRVFVLRRKIIAALIKQSINEWNIDNAPRLSAALAFYTLLSLSPLVIVTISMAGFAFGQAAAGGQLAREIHNLVGWDVATAIQAVIRAGQRPHTSAVAALLSVLMLAFGATTVMVELRSGLNTIWRVPANPCNSSLKAMLRMGKERLYSLALVVGGGILLLTSLAASTWVTAVGRSLGHSLAIPESRLHEATFAASYVTITVLFAAVYRTLPDTKLEWRDVAVGACITSLIFTVGKQLIALYLIKAAFASMYGAAGSIVVLLVWVYYSAQLFFLGAEFTKVYARTCGSQRSAPRNDNPASPATQASPWLSPLPASNEENVELPHPHRDAVA